MLYTTLGIASAGQPSQKQPSKRTLLMTTFFSLYKVGYSWMIEAEEYHSKRGKSDWREGLDPLGVRIVSVQQHADWPAVCFDRSPEVDFIVESQVPTFLPNPDVYWGPGKKTKIVKAAQSEV